jgi:hypothetical protein
VRYRRSASFGRVASVTQLGYVNQEVRIHLSTRRVFLVRNALLAAGVSTLPLLRPALLSAQRTNPAEDLVDAETGDRPLAPHVAGQKARRLTSHLLKAAG